MLPEAEVSTLGNAPRDLSKDFLEVLRYGAGMAPILGEGLDYAESAYANKYGTDFFGRPMHGPLNAGITTAGIVVPNIIETPVKAGVNVVKKALPKMGPKVKKFKSSIDWGKWNPEIPNNPKLMKEYLEIEKKTKADGGWMKNPDGTPFDGPPELFVQTKSEAFQKAFPNGYDKLYRGAAVGGNKGLTSTSKSMDFEGETQFFSEHRSQAEEYAKSGAGNRETVGADYADRSSGVYELAYPPDTPRLDLDTRGSGFANVELFSEKTVPELEKGVAELKEILRTSKNASERSNAAYNLEWMEEGLKYIKENPNPKRVSSDAEISEFLDRYRKWDQSSDDAAIPNGMITDDIAIFMEENPELYDRIVLRGLDDESIGDVNMINMSKAPYPKSLKGNVGTFNLNDPNVFKAVIPAVGLGAAATYKNKDEMGCGGRVKLKKMSKGGVTVKKKEPTKGESPYFFNVYPDHEPREYVNVDGYLTPADFQEFHEEGDFITAQDVARLADERAGNNAKYTFDEFMNILAQGESENKNVYQKGGPAQGEWQMEFAARQDAANYVRDLAEGLGLDAPSYSDEDLKDITKLPYEDRRLLAYAYMYGPESVPTRDVLTGKTPIPKFWMKHWNKGEVDRSQEFGERVSDYLK